MGKMILYVFILSWILLVLIQKHHSQESEYEKLLAKAAEDAKTADRAKTLFLANMSHEIRTPMNIILAATQLLSETCLNSEQKHYIQILKNSGSGLLNIINDILDFSKFEANQMSFENLCFSLKDLSHQSILSFETLASKKKLRLNWKFDEKIPENFIGDPLRINQILNNLISNAIKFTEKGEVSLCVKPNSSQHPGNILIEIEDTGIGIDPNFAKDLFKVFAQAESSIHRRFGGAGLGLAISKKIVEHFNGEIWFESELKKGTRFSFTLQLSPSHVPLKTESQVDHIKIDFTERSLDILLVEDVIENIYVIKALFKRTKWVFDDCYNGVEAINKFKLKKYDLILMDIEMPTMNGLETTKVIREIEKCEQKTPTPILGLSAHVLKEFRDQMIEAGCDGYLAKPLSRSSLTEAVIKQCFK